VTTVRRNMPTSGPPRGDEALVSDRGNGAPGGRLALTQAWHTPASAALVKGQNSVPLIAVVAELAAQEA
jgi:hypothetical protein